MKYLQSNVIERLEKFNTLGMLPDEIAVLSILETVQAVSEKPLPLEPIRLLKIIGSKAKRYKEALEFVLSHFFVKTEDGYISEEVMSHAEYVRGKQDAGKKGGNSKAQKTSSTTPSKTQKVLDENGPKTPSKTLANKTIDNIKPLSLSSERDVPPTPKVDDVTPASVELISVPSDLVPDFHAETIARSKGVDIETEQIKFIAHYQARPEEKRKGVEAWQAQFRKWLCDAACISADRNRVNEARVKAASRPQFAVREKFSPIKYLQEQHNERGFGNHGEPIDITSQCQSLD